MLKYLTVLIASLTLSCSGWQEKSIVYAEGVAVQARVQGRPIFDKRCMSEAENCADSGDRVCQALLDCQAARRKYVKSVMALHYAVVDARLTLQIGSAESVSAAVNRALQLAAEVMSQVKQFGGVK